MIRPFLTLGLLLGSVTSMHAASARITVYGETEGYYHHPKGEDGKSRDTTYTIRFGKALPSTLGDQVENATFATALATSITQELASRHFVLSSDPAKAEQLIIVHAGTTQPVRRVTFGSISSDDGSAPVTILDVIEDRRWLSNIDVLGYTRAINEASSLDVTVFGRTMRQDLYDDLGDSRNYLVISAYENRKAQSKTAPDLLWRTFVNVEAGDVSFAEQVDTMLASASRYLGRNSARIIRKFNSDVQIGEATVVEDDTPTAPSP